MYTYSETTQNIRIDVEPCYLPDQSQPDAHQFVFSYNVHITNLGHRSVQLLRRFWTIADGNGRVRTVEGEGVVGQQPTLRPGESYEYSSFCPLPTPTGNMRGKYQMRGEDGALFYVTVPLFFFRDHSLLH